jgi:hypothetical protein
MQQDESGLLSPERRADEDPDPGVSMLREPAPGLLSLSTAVTGQRDIPAMGRHLAMT